MFRDRADQGTIDLEFSRSLRKKSDELHKESANVHKLVFKMDKKLGMTQNICISASTTTMDAKQICTKHLDEVCKDFSVIVASCSPRLQPSPPPLPCEPIKFLSKSGNEPKSLSTPPPNPRLQFPHLENEEVGLITPWFSPS